MNFHKEAMPVAAQATQAVDILAFVEAREISPHYFETPYYLAPAPGMERDYALLRDTLRLTSKVGIAYVVIQAKQHLAALIPHGQSLVLNTLRWSALDGRVAHDTARRDSITAPGAVDCLQAFSWGRFSGPTLHHMQVTGCDDVDDDFDDCLEESPFDGDDLRRALLHPRRHETAPQAARSATGRCVGASARARRPARRA